MTTVIVLTCKYEGDETKQEAAEPEHETREDDLQYERLFVVRGVHLVRLSIAGHGRKYNAPGVSVLHHVDDTGLLWCW